MGITIARGMGCVMSFVMNETKNDLGMTGGFNEAVE